MIVSSLAVPERGLNVGLFFALLVRSLGLCSMDSLRRSRARDPIKGGAAIHNPARNFCLVVYHPRRIERHRPNDPDARFDRHICARNDFSAGQSAWRTEVRSHCLDRKNSRQNQNNAEPPKHLRTRRHQLMEL